MTSVSRTAQGFTITDTAAITVSVVFIQEPTEFIAVIRCPEIYCEGPLEILASDSFDRTVRRAYRDARNIARNPSIW